MSVEQHLERAFGKADHTHIHWQTSHPVVGAEEARLVRTAFLPLGERVLDLGCAEGATLYHLGDPENATGLDLFEEKLDVARTMLTRATLVKGSAYELPFEARSFDHVIVRDVIHHLDEPERAIGEIARVLGPGGRVDILEPCRYNPLIFAHAALTPAERGELRSTPAFLESLLSASFRVEPARAYQPMPIHRLMFHPKLFSSSQSAWLRQLVGAVESAAERLVPKTFWAYIHVRAFR